MTPAAFAAFFVFVWITPTLHREYTLRPSYHAKEPGFDLLNDRQWLESEYAIYWKYFLAANSEAAKLEVMHRIDRYKKNCQILTRESGTHWEKLCDRHTQIATAMAGAMQFGLVLWITSYLKVRRSRRQEVADNADGRKLSVYGLA